MTTKLPTTQVWFRNPRNYMREVTEAGAINIAWDWGTLVKYGIDPERFATLHYGAGQEWHGLVVANEGAIEIGPSRGLQDPIAVYPVWSYTEDVSILEELIANPVGDDPEMYNDPNLPPAQRPIQGQPHKVIVCDLPTAASNIARKFLRELKELQTENPECIIHVHGMYAWKALFGMGFRSIDWEARSDSANGIVILPNGKTIKEDKSSLHTQWISLLGMRPVDLKQAEKRCVYNIRSAMWAGDNYLKAVKFKTTGIDNPDIDNPTALMEIQQVKHYAQGLRGKEGDKFLCNTCSLADKCKYYREGSVCTLPATQTRDLAKMFGSRDADQIVDALGVLVKANTRRLEQGMQNEDDDGAIDQKVSRLLDEIFSQGQKLAKLIDPAKFATGKVQVNVGRVNTEIIAGNPNQMIAEVVRSLEDQGFNRHEITNDMIAGVLSSMANNRPALENVVEGEVVEA